MVQFVFDIGTFVKKVKCQADFIRFPLWLRAQATSCDFASNKVNLT